MPKASILVVEDDRDIRENLRALLEGEGYPVWDAPHGRAALELLGTLPALPGLIFLDLSMPVMDGRAFLKAMRANADLTHLPVVVLTAASDRFDEKVTAFIRKPFDLDVVLQHAARFAQR